MLINLSIILYTKNKTKKETDRNYQISVLLTLINGHKQPLTTDSSGRIQENKTRIVNLPHCHLAAAN